MERGSLRPPLLILPWMFLKVFMADYLHLLLEFQIKEFELVGLCLLLVSKVLMVFVFYWFNC